MSLETKKFAENKSSTTKRMMGAQGYFVAQFKLSSTKWPSDFLSFWHGVKLYRTGIRYSLSFSRTVHRERSIVLRGWIPRSKKKKKKKPTRFPVLSLLIKIMNRQISLVHCTRWQKFHSVVFFQTTKKPKQSEVKFRWEWNGKLSFIRLRQNSEKIVFFFERIDSKCRETAASPSVRGVHEKKNSRACEASRHFLYWTVNSLNNIAIYIFICVSACKYTNPSWAINNTWKLDKMPRTDFSELHPRRGKGEWRMAPPSICLYRSRGK